MRMFYLLLSLLVITGCSDAPNLGEVTGTVTYQGSPLKQGGITFVPEDGSRESSGKIVDGKIVDVTTFKPGDGAVVGKSKVLIRAYKNPDAMDNLQSIIPTKYGEVDKTPLSAEIKSGQNELTFELKKQ